MKSNGRARKAFKKQPGLRPPPYVGAYLRVRRRRREEAIVEIGISKRRFRAS